MQKIAILGADETAKMLIQSASALNIPVRVLTTQADAPAHHIAPDVHHVDWHAPDTVADATADCDLIALTTTSVPLATLQTLTKPIFPHLNFLETFYDRLQQRRTLQKHFEVPRFRQVSVATDILDAVQEFGFPVLLKPRYGELGAGERILIQRAHDIQPALDKLAGRGALMVDGVVKFLRELAVTLVRRADGAIRLYPVVEVVRRDQHLFTVRCPAAIDEATAVRAVEMARQIVEEADAVGVFTIQMFEVETNEVVFDEIVPHPSNIANYTIEGTITSQYENYLRAIQNLPLGDVFQIAPATAMVNIIAEQSGAPNPDPIRDALATEGAHIHIYGKQHVRASEAVGHITVLGYNTDGAEKVARLALSRVKL